MFKVSMILKHRTKAKKDPEINSIKFNIYK